MALRADRHARIEGVLPGRVRVQEPSDRHCVQFGIRGPVRHHHRGLRAARTGGIPLSEGAGKSAAPRGEHVNEAPLQIEIAYAEPQRAIVKSYFLAWGSRVADALRLAALDPDFTGVDLENSTVGIFGRATGPDQVLA